MGLEFMKNFLVRRLLYGLMTIAIVVSAICATTRVASAVTLNVRAVNSSDRAMWFIPLWSYHSQIGWRGHENGFCLSAGQSRNTEIVYNHLLLGPEVRIVAEVKKDARDCAGRESTVKEFTWENKDLPWSIHYGGGLEPRTLEAHLVGRDGNYSFGALIRR